MKLHSKVGYVLACACLSAPSVGESALKLEQIHAEKEALMQSMEMSSSDIVPLGTGYQSDGDYFLGLQTVDGVLDETLGNSIMDFRVGVDLSYSQVIDLIDGTVDAGFNFPAIRVDAGANYAKEISADKYSGTYSVYASMKPKSQMWLPVDDSGYQPTISANELAVAYPGNRAEHLGDKFVNGFALGSNVVINMKIDYRDEADKRAIGGYLGVDWVGKVEVDGALQLLDDEKKKSVKISVSGYQSGGEPNRLLDIIPNGIMLCTLENPTPCFDLFEEAIVYLKQDYINQFDELTDYNVTDTYLVEYERAGPGLQALVPENGYQQTSYLTKLIVKDTTGRWIDERLINRRAKNLQRYYASAFTAQEIADLSEIEQQSRDNANMYADIVDYCEKNPQGTYCADFEAEVVSNYIQDYSNIISVLE